MPTNLDQVIADPAFQKHASAMRAASPKGPVQSLDGVFEQVQRFASVRRREVRVALLQEAGRAGASDWHSHRERVPEAVGAIISWEADGVKRSRLKTSGGSYLSSHDPREILGVGPAAKITSVQIKWPSGQVDKLTDLPINKYIKVVEGQAAPKPASAK